MLQQSPKSSGNIWVVQPKLKCSGKMAVENKPKVVEQIHSGISEAKFEAHITDVAGTDGKNCITDGEVKLSTYNKQLTCSLNNYFSKMSLLQQLKHPYCRYY